MNETVDARRSTREAPEAHFARVALMWSALLQHTVTPRQVLLCMAALKLAREAGMHDPDNVIDATGYLSMLDEV